MLCANSSTSINTCTTNQLVWDFSCQSWWVWNFSCQSWCYTHYVTYRYMYMYLCGMVSQFIILSLYFLGRHVLSLYTRELIQFVKGMAHHQFIRDLVPSFLVYRRLDLPVYTHIIRIKLLIIYTIVTTSLMSGLPYQYL